MTGDRVDCIGVYVDDRVRSERWVRRNSIDTLTSSTGSLALPDEPDALQSDVEQLLEVCKKSTFLSPPPELRDCLVAEKTSPADPFAQSTSVTPDHPLRPSWPS